MLETAIERVEALNPALNAVVNRLYDQARAAVAAGLPAGPFTGVPYALKDLGALYTGAVTSYGSRLFAGSVADHDSEYTTRLKRAGLVILAKTNTPEMGLAPSTEPRLFGPTRNPWNLAHSAGGSSGGAAAAVAGGMLPMAHATDGGGSIRIPASCCGLFGLKPTRARNPMGPDAGEGWGGASVGHAVTRSVRDSAALLDVTAGPDVGDPYWAPPPAGPFLDEVGRPPGRLRIALATASWNGAPVDPECAAAATDAARLCESLGHHVEEARPDFDRDALAQATRIIIGANVRAALDAGAKARGRALEAGDVERVDLGVRGAGRHPHRRRLRALDGSRAPDRPRGGPFLHPTRHHPVADHVPAALSPRRARHVERRTRTPTWPRCSPPSASPRSSTRRGTRRCRCRWPGREAALPLGVQFAGPFGGEALLFRLAGQLEAARPWAARRPTNLPG